MNAPARELSLFPKEEMEMLTVQPHVINVSSVPQRSPFRYPGGKTWLIPTARKWFAGAKRGSFLVEPFAGGGIISLTAAAERYFDHITMVEIDNDVAAVWQTILSDESDWLINQISSFEVTAENINQVIANAKDGLKECAFSTIVRNRTNHGGILAKGSGLIKSGEKGKGLASRWYPETLVRRIKEIQSYKDRISFFHGDAFQVMDRYLYNKNAFFFIDPPYTIAGKRLYNHFEVDHRRIFEMACQMRGSFLLTYDDTPEVRSWVEEYHLPYITIPMQTTHLVTKEEILVSNDFGWLNIPRYMYERKAISI